MKIKLYARIDELIVNKLKFVAKLRGVSLSTIIREAMVEYLKKWTSGDIDG